MTTSITQQVEKQASIDQHKLVSVSQLLHELRARGIQITHERILKEKLTNYSQQGAIPGSISKPDPLTGSVSDHYPLWVVQILEEIDKLEKQGLNSQQVIQQLAGYPVYSAASAHEQLNKVRRGGGAVTGSSQLANVRNLVRTGIKSTTSHSN
jgi:hypothetical protein